jgi:hypothetical protein
MKCFLALLAVAMMITAVHARDAGDPRPAQVPVEVPAGDLNTATNTIKEAWHDFNRCRRPSACRAYFETFGVAISFADGSIAPFSHTQRLDATGRDCIKNARASLEQGNRSLALQWVMASRIENIRERDWLGNHPEAVLKALEALNHCCW